MPENKKKESKEEKKEARKERGADFSPPDEGW
jgi:hypothetical protein